MNLFQTLNAARAARKDLVRVNDKVRRELITAIEDARLSDDRWSADIPRDEAMGQANRALFVAYRTSHPYESTTIELRLHLIVRDGGTVDIYDANGKLLATELSASGTLHTIARLVAEFEWPNELPGT